MSYILGKENKEAIVRPEHLERYDEYIKYMEDNYPLSIAKMRGARGLSDGKRIYLDYTLSGYKAIYVFLHELAHHKRYQVFDSDRYIIEHTVDEAVSMVETEEEIAEKFAGIYFFILFGFKFESSYYFNEREIRYGIEQMKKLNDMAKFDKMMKDMIILETYKEFNLVE